MIAHEQITEFDPTIPLYQQQIAIVHLDCKGLGLLQELHRHSPVMDRHTGFVAQGVLKCSTFYSDSLDLRSVLLHDIWKINIDKKILERNGPLSPEEMAQIRLHPEKSVELAIAQGIKLSDEQIIYIALHHLRFAPDGSPSKWSYPDVEYNPFTKEIFYKGIKVEPQMLQNLSVLAFWDTLEAMTSEDRKGFKNYVPMDKAEETMLKLIKDKVFSPNPDPNEILEKMLPHALNIRLQQLRLIQRIPKAIEIGA